MARTIPSGRFDALLRAAEEQFILRGYALTQMDDVAKALGVAKGTLYGYVESKQALFDFVVRHTGRDESLPIPEVLPLPTPQPGATLEALRDRMSETGGFPLLAAAIAAESPADPGAEVEALGGELFEVFHRFRMGLKLMQRSSRDYPELHALWNRMGRQALLDQLEAYISARVEAGVFRPIPNPRLTARFCLECIITWAVYIHWDSAPDDIDLDEMRETVLAFLRRGLLNP